MSLLSILAVAAQATTFTAVGTPPSGGPTPAPVWDCEDIGSDAYCSGTAALGLWACDCDEAPGESWCRVGKCDKSCYEAGFKSPCTAPPGPTPGGATWKYNAMAAGQAGTGSYATIMGVQPEDIAGPMIPYFTFEDMKDSTCMFCTNLWSVSSPTNLDHLENDAFPKHSKAFAAQSMKPAYKDYSASKNDDYIVGAYATEWAIYRQVRTYGFDSVPFYTGVDYLLYGFIPLCGKGLDGQGQLALCTVNDCANVNSVSNPYFALQQACSGIPDGSLVVHDPWGAFAANNDTTRPSGYIGGELYTGHFHHLLNAKAEYKDSITIMPSIGGWSLSKPFFDMHDETIRSNFINSAVNLLTAWPFFDGIDIDWEFPGGLGADAGKVQYPLAADFDVTMPSVSNYNCDACCRESPDDRRNSTVYASFANAMQCGANQSLSPVTDIAPMGCSQSRDKRQEIADGYHSWSTAGKTKEDFLNCECDANIAQKIFSEIRVAMDKIPMNERPSEFTNHPAGAKYQLTTAISGAPGKINEVDYGRLVAEGNLDHVFIMSYDFMGAWGGVGHQTNLYPTPNQDISILNSVQTLFDQGVPSKALMVGVASYGRGWSGNFSTAYQNSDIQAAIDVGSLSACAGDIENGVVDYATIVSKTSSGAMKQVWDECASAHLTIGPNEVYTGDSEESVFAKGKFVKENKLAGLFTWELAQDDHASPLVNAMNEALGRVPAGGSIVPPTGANWQSSSCAKPLNPVAYASRTFKIQCDE